MSEEERRKVLELIESGMITAEQGLSLLKALQEEVQLSQEDINEQAESSSSSAQTEAYSRTGALPPAAEAVIEDLPPQPETPPQEVAPGITRWRTWWWIPLAIGVTITVISGVLMFLAFQSSGYGFWFACTWFPFLFGVAVMALAWASRTARWLHVRIQQKPGEHPQKISISLPIPLHLASWFFRTFKNRIPGLDNADLDGVIMALEHVSPDAPFYVEVDEDDGEHVEVFIG